MTLARPIVLAIGLLAGCKAKKAQEAQPIVARDASVVVTLDAAVDDAPELAGYPRVDAERTVTIPATKARGDEVGPVIANDLAIVGGTAFGFAAIDVRRGGIAWTKPAGAHVAPPLVHGTSIVLVGECERYVPVPDGELLLGCVRVVTTTGSDEAFMPVHGKRSEVEAFAASAGAQALWGAGETAVRWRKGNEAVTIDLLDGAARRASSEPPPLAITYQGTRWDIAQREGRIVARGKRPWQTEHAYTAVLGTVWTAEGAPLVRVLDLGAYAGTPEAHLIDIDAGGSMRATVARPTPGVALLGHGVSARGDAAIALRGSSGRDFVVGYAANALLVYVHALPRSTRVRAHVGVAVAPDAVVVFHDGDRVTILPELSAPPTAPGATSSASQNPTP